MFTLGQEHIIEEASKPQPIMFTAGAIPVKNKKGEMSMEKVHVKRYVAGKRPEWADDYDEDDDEEEEKFGKPDIASDNEEDVISRIRHPDVSMNANEDRRLKRLMQHRAHDDVEERQRRRRIHEPEVIEEASESEDQSDEEKPKPAMTTIPMAPDEESSDEGELDEDEIENRRAQLRERARAHRDADEEILALPTESKDQEDDEEQDKMEEEFTTDEESEYTDSDDDGPRLKPVFVRKKDRLTIQEREKEEERQRILQEEKKKLVDERRKYTIKMVEKEARAEHEMEQMALGRLDAALDAVDSDDGNDEAEYELWKLRELKRIKRDREEREALQKEKEEIDRFRNLTEEEKRAELRNNPREVTNQMEKGKYKFLQKYYHRGAFFMDKQETMFTKDFTAPTLDDHFDKTILPKVMQVKNFGRSGRTKYTHLVDQDTTAFDSPWTQDSASSSKFQSTKAGGMKQVFDRPRGTKQRKT
uniref:Micro-fibrillar-associated protein 1 C-terminal domain-containing protein n=1 Tax=Ciona savignyi TaxID=51511 RepID=H2Y7U4_CIOSA